MKSQLKHVLSGAGMAVAALILAWGINGVFQRSWLAIALVLLAMLIAMLLQRLVTGAVPGESTHPALPDIATGEERPSIREEAARLPGVDRRYVWMILPPVLAFIGVVLVMIV